MKTLSRLKDVRVLGIDPSSHSLAWGVCKITLQGDIEFESAGKIPLVKQEGVSASISSIVGVLPGVIKSTNPDYFFIEQPVYIQNFQTSRILSYIVGASIAMARVVRVPVVEASPLVWKTGIGYSKVTKKDIVAWSIQMGEKEAKKKASYERKNRIRNLLIKRYGDKFNDHEKYDADVVDAIGIATWGCQQRLDVV